jgi:hypothetical protein
MCAKASAIWELEQWISFSLLEFGDPYGLLSLVRTRVRSLLCAEFSIRNILGFLCWTQKRCPRAAYRCLEYCFLNKDFDTGREFWLFAE